MQIIKDIIKYKKKFSDGKLTPRYFWRVYKRLRREFYLSEEWKLLSREIRKRDVTCKCGSYSQETDHIVPLFEAPELALVWSNLQGICKKCHKRKHAILSKRTKSRRGYKRAAVQLLGDRTVQPLRRTWRLYK